MNFVAGHLILVSLCSWTTSLSVAVDISEDMWHRAELSALQLFDTLVQHILPPAFYSDSTETLLGSLAGLRASTEVPTPKECTQ